MKQTFNREKILSALKVVSPALSGRNLVKNTQEYLFFKDSIAAFNDEICIRYPFEGLFICSVPAEELIGALSSSKSENISIEEKDDVMEITAKDIKSQISISKDNEMFDTVLSLEMAKQWKPLGEDFKLSLKICSESTSEDFTQGFLTAIAIEKNRILSSDDQRITCFNLKSPLGISKQILLPAKSIKSLIGFDIVKIGVTSSWVHFQTKNQIIFSSRLLLEEFPDPSDFFEIDGVEVEFPKGLSEAVSQMLVFCQREFNTQGQIRCTFSQGNFKLFAQNSAAWVEKNMPVEYEGEPFSFFVNPNFINELTEKCPKVTVSIEESKALFEGDNFKHAIMLSSEEI